MSKKHYCNWCGKKVSKPLLLESQVDNVLRRGFYHKNCHKKAVDMLKILNNYNGT